MLVIASTIPSDEMGMDYFQETNTIKLFDDCSYYNQMITRQSRYRELYRLLSNISQFPKRSCGDRPSRDVSELDAEEGSTSTQIFKTNPVIRPSDDELKSLSTLINNSKK